MAQVVDPPEALDLQTLGVPGSTVIDLALRRALREGQTSTLRLAEALCVSPILMEQAVEQLRRDGLIEIHGMEGRNYILTLSESGKRQAHERMAVCRYAGPVPVSLADYARTVRSQHTNQRVTRDTVRRALSDLVILPSVMEELGPAIHAQGAMFLYGPPGTGKSSIAERLIRVNEDSVLVPHAVEVDGQIISVFDPVLHEPVQPQPERLDRRWVRCHRPSIVVGGELTAGQLDLTLQEHAGIYLAPLQMQANNGILVIDDFGRQTLTPEQLLNRWIVPLDRAVDFLKLDYGLKFEIPFLAKIVFATNLEPARLADEAFFRRIRSKIHIPPIDDATFDEVLNRAAASTGITLAPDAPAALRTGSRERGDGDLRPYLPKAICELVGSITEYDDLPPLLDAPMVDRALSLYFSHSVRENFDEMDYLGGGLPRRLVQAVVGERERPAPGGSILGTDGLGDGLDAACELLWVSSPEDARRLTTAFVERLGGTVERAPTRPEGALETDIGFDPSAPAWAVVPADSPAASRLERHLPPFVHAAHRALALQRERRLLDDELQLDQLTGLPGRTMINRAVGRPAPGDTIILLQLDGFATSDPGADTAARDRVSGSFGALLRDEVRHRDRAGYYGNGKFVVMLLDGIEQDPHELVDRLRKSWADRRPAPVSFSAGIAPAAPNPRSALVAAEAALFRAHSEGGDRSAAAEPADYDDGRA